MLLKESDLTPLPGVTPGEKVHRVLRKADTILTLLLLFISGFGTGYIYAARSAENLMAIQRQDHLREISGLQAQQSVQLRGTAEKVEAAAGEVKAAAEATAVNTEKVDQAIKKVDQAASKVSGK